MRVLIKSTAMKNNTDLKTTYIHNIPFGTSVNKDGKITFNLWAPDAKEIKLCLIGSDNKESKIKMQKVDNGFFTIITDKAHIGSLYQYQIDGGLLVPDPASRSQQKDVHGPSIVVDPNDFDWEDETVWKGHPWDETIIYELHVGTFTREGTFNAVKEKLDYLVDLGITAIELMPIADFPGRYNWGYDGVLQYAPDKMYGTTNELKDLIKTAHKKGLMVFLDVVYNHFGPEGNYLYVYARSKFFSDKFKTPWGDAINFSEKWVREFFINNALFWLKEYRFDGLRFDAIHAIKDDSEPDITKELALRIRDEIGNKRNIHLILENDGNESRYLKVNSELNPIQHTAQWNDDLHHAIHIAITGENEGYYADYTKANTSNPVSYFLARSLAEGFAYQGQKSVYRNGESRGESTKELMSSAFINFIQNHDQIGNRAFGERLSSIVSIEKYKAAACLYLLCPSIPMLFMGEEWACDESFLFFCDLGEELADSIREGRRKEFSEFHQFRDPKVRETIPDPLSQNTFKKSILNWQIDNIERQKDCLQFYKTLLCTRKEYIIPIMKQCKTINTNFEIINRYAFCVNWFNNDKIPILTVIANMGNDIIPQTSVSKGNIIAKSNETGLDSFIKNGILSSNSVYWFLNKV